MLNLVSRQRVSHGLLVLTLIVVMLTGTVSTTPWCIDVVTLSDDPVEILLLLDHNYGGNVPYIISIFERYEWSITTTALNETLTSCSYLGNQLFTVDILMTEISDVSQFDVISIMPGNAHELLRTNQTSLDLINAAVDAGIIVSAWCRGVRVLAAADVIDGKNITGSAVYADEYEAAGATFNELVPPIIDGNIVTGVRSRFYREEMCQTIATAVGVYETDIPVFVNASASQNPGVEGSSVNLTAEFTDATGVYSVNARIFALNDSTGERLLPDVEYLTLNETVVDGVFTGVVEDLEIGNYTIDFTVWDLYMNEITYVDKVNLLILGQDVPNGFMPNLLQLAIPGVMIGSAVIVVLVIYLRRR